MLFKKPYLSCQLRLAGFMSNLENQVREEWLADISINLLLMVKGRQFYFKGKFYKIFYLTDDMIDRRFHQTTLNFAKFSIKKKIIS